MSTSYFSAKDVQSAWPVSAFLGNDAGKGKVEMLVAEERGGPREGTLSENIGTWIS